MTEPRNWQHVLSAEYEAWSAANGFPGMCADELLSEAQAVREGLPSAEVSRGVTDEQVDWLKRFIERWNHHENEEWAEWAAKWAEWAAKRGYARRPA